MGTTIENVRPIENTQFLLDNMEDYLHYDYKLDEENSYTVTYHFSKTQLYAIEVDIYIDNIDHTHLLFRDFTDLFNKKYTRGKLEEDGYATWYSSFKKKKIEFALKEDSEKYGFISIKIRQLDDD